MFYWVPNTPLQQMSSYKIYTNLRSGCVGSKYEFLVNLFLVNPADLVTFTEEILNGKHRFLCSSSAVM